MLQGEHLSGATHPALNFINNQEDAMLIANASQLSKKTLGRRHISSLALHWFDDDSGDFLGRRSRLEQPILNPIHRALDHAAVAAVFGAEWIAILVRIRHVHNVQHLSLKPDALRGF